MQCINCLQPTFIYVSNYKTFQSYGFLGLFAMMNLNNGLLQCIRTDFGFNSLNSNVSSGVSQVAR